jgi:succinyl-CoA synthetase beta subunit
MRLQEYQCKTIFANYEIPIPKGKVATSAGEAVRIAEELDSNVVIKAQVLVRNRSKAGGIRLAKSPKEAEEIADAIFGLRIKGLPVRKVLVEEAATFEKEIYLGISYNPITKMPTLLVSQEGGHDIEDVAAVSPEKIKQLTIDPMRGLMDYQVRDLMGSIDLPRNFWRMFAATVTGLWNVFRDYDAMEVEINPLVIARDQRLLALDCKMVMDDYALFRHQNVIDLRDNDIEDLAEAEARRFGMSYIRLNGNIGVLANGAGLAMASVDTIQMNNGQAANFLDIGEGENIPRIRKGLNLIVKNTAVKVVLLVMYGRGDFCNDFVNGLIQAVRESCGHLPVVVYLNCDNLKTQCSLLRSSGFMTADSLEAACKVAVSIASGERHEYTNR